MAYVSDSNLTQFWGLAKDYINAEDGRFANWQKTEKSGAVTCWPVGETPLLPTVDFMFTETGPAEGTKGPDNPSAIAGVTQAKVTRCGKNLIRGHVSGSQTINGITFTVGDDGSVTASGTASSDAVFYYATTGYKVQLKAGCQYALSGCPAGGSNSTYYIRESNLSFSDFGSSAITTASIDTLASVRIVVMSGTTVSNLVFKPQIELGSTATTFEPYDGADYPLPLGGTYYGGTVDLATGVMTVTHETTVLNGSEGWVLSSSSTETISTFLASNVLSYSPAPEYGGACTHIPLYSGPIVMDSFRVFTSKSVTLRLDATDFQTADALKSWLQTQNSAGTPVKITYALATPLTVQLTPTEILSLAQQDKYTPRLNTVYTDARAVQVGYAKSPIRSEYELTQAIIATEGGE